VRGLSRQISAIMGFGALLLSAVPSADPTANDRSDVGDRKVTRSGTVTNPLRERAKMTRDSVRRILLFLALVGAALMAQGAVAQTPGSVTVSVVQGGATKNYQIPWLPAMSVLNALEQALPTNPGMGSLSLNYFPQYGGYFVSAVAGVPAPGVNEFWATCLLPAGPGSTTITLPLAPNRILVGSGDTVILAYNQPCPGTPSAH
jgi:hypothetical protein